MAASTEEAQLPSSFKDVECPKLESIDLKIKANGNIQCLNFSYSPKKTQAIAAEQELEKSVTILAEAPVTEEEVKKSPEKAQEETSAKSKTILLSFIGVAVSLVIATLVYFILAIFKNHDPIIPLPVEEFKLSPFWNFRKNPFICAKSEILIDEQEWCDKLFNNINIHDERNNFKPLTNQNREITDYLSDYHNHYMKLRDLKVYQDKNYLWWLDKLHLRACTEAIPTKLPIKFTPMKKYWTNWDATTKKELKKYLDDYFKNKKTKYQPLFLKPGHTGCVKGIMTLMFTKNNPDHKCAFGEGKSILYDPEKTASFQLIEERIDQEFYMNPAIKYDKKFENPTPHPSIIIEEEMKYPVLEIKCSFIFGIMKQCFTWGYNKKYHGKFNRNLECILNDYKNNTTQEGCKNLIESLDWIKIIPQLEELAFKLHMDRVRIDIFRVNYNEFYINEYDPRSYSDHTNNKYLFDELKAAWKNAQYLPENRENAFQDFNGKCQEMQKRLNDYKGQFI